MGFLLRYIYIELQQLHDVSNCGHRKIYSLQRR